MGRFTPIDFLIAPTIWMTDFRCISPGTSICSTEDEESFLLDFPSVWVCNTWLSNYSSFFDYLYLSLLLYADAESYKHGYVLLHGGIEEWSFARLLGCGQQCCEVWCIHFPSVPTSYLAPFFTSGAPRFSAFLCSQLPQALQHLTCPFDPNREDA